MADTRRVGGGVLHLQGFEYLAPSLCGLPAQQHFFTALGPKALHDAGSIQRWGICKYFCHKTVIPAGGRASSDAGPPGPTGDWIHLVLLSGVKVVVLLVWKQFLIGSMKSEVWDVELIRAAAESSFLLCVETRAASEKTEKHVGGYFYPSIRAALLSN